VELILEPAGEREGIGVVDRENVRPKFTPEFAKQIARLGKFDVSGSSPSPPRAMLPGEMLSPSYSVLDNSGLKASGRARFGSRQGGFRQYSFRASTTRWQAMPEIVRWGYLVTI
jgi:hypothetical protein